MSIVKNLNIQRSHSAIWYSLVSKREGQRNEGGEVIGYSSQITGYVNKHGTNFCFPFHNYMIFISCFAVNTSVFLFHLLKYPKLLHRGLNATAHLEAKLRAVLYKIIPTGTVSIITYKAVHYRLVWLEKPTLFCFDFTNLGLWCFSMF